MQRGAHMHYLTATWWQWCVCDPFMINLPKEYMLFPPSVVQTKIHCLALRKTKSLLYRSAGEVHKVHRGHEGKGAQQPFYEATEGISVDKYEPCLKWRYRFTTQSKFRKGQSTKALWRLEILQGLKQGVTQGRIAGPNCGRPMHLITVSALDVVGIVATGSTEGIQAGVLHDPFPYIFSYKDLSLAAWRFVILDKNYWIQDIWKW